MTDDLDKFRFNRAVARIRELTNAIEELPEESVRCDPGAPAVLREGLETVARLLGTDDAASGRGNVADPRAARACSPTSPGRWPIRTSPATSR